MRLPLAKGRGRRADRLTLGLAGLAAVTAGSVVAGELVRLARRRAFEHEPPESLLGTAELALETAGRATQDTVAVAIEGYETTARHEAVLFNLLLGFLGGFAVMRLSTHGIRGGWWPLGNVRVGGRHVHHFVPGILIAFASGAFAIVTESRRLEQALALPFGTGVGMTFDEAALLLDLRDVYWSREGLLSVQVSLGMLALLGATIIALRMLRRGERQAEARGEIPARPPRDPWGSAQTMPLADQPA